MLCGSPVIRRKESGSLFNLKRVEFGHHIKQVYKPKIKILPFSTALVSDNFLWTVGPIIQGFHIRSRMLYKLMALNAHASLKLQD